MKVWALLLVAVKAKSTQAFASEVGLIDISNVTFDSNIDSFDSSSTLSSRLHHVISHVERQSRIDGWGSKSSNRDEGQPAATVQLGHGSADLAPGSFTIKVETMQQQQQVIVKVVASDTTGLQSALGRLARELRVTTGRVAIPGDLNITVDGSKALWPLRGHQYSAQHHPSMFKTWTEFDSFTHDNGVFGTNQIELAHFDVKTETNVADLIQYSTHLDSDGVNVSFWWSLNLFTDNRTGTELAWKGMPKVNSIFFPGGDGGALVWPDIQDAATVLHKYHPDAKVWVSAQEFNASDLTDFFKTIDTPSVRSYLHGVVVGPHWSVPTAEIVKRMPAGYAVRQYPDICHPRGAQYAITDWHWAWQSTAGRQMINPMPLQHSSIVRLRSNGSTPTIGVGAYSEGLNDDLNKVIWSALAESPDLSVHEIVSQYARYHFGADAEDAMVSALFGLEQNWGGDIGTNLYIASTLSTLQAVENASAATELSSNWRLQMYLYRGYFDAIIQAEYQLQQSNENMAMDALATAPSVGSAAAISAATEALHRTADAANPTIPVWRNRLYQLQSMINASVGTEVLQGQDTTLNLVGIYHKLNDAAFLMPHFASISTMSTEAEKLRSIAFLLDWTNPGPGGFYDNLAGGNAPHLDSGPGAALDPDFYQSPYTTYDSKATNSTARLSWQSYALTFYDNSLNLVYTELDQNAQYVLDIVYFGKVQMDGGGGSSGGSRLMANDELLHDYKPAPEMMQVESFPISKETTSGGSVVLRCNQPPGMGGTGRACQISEIWLRQM